jgi:hypothetical protein
MPSSRAARSFFPRRISPSLSLSWTMDFRRCIRIFQCPSSGSLALGRSMRRSSFRISPCSGCPRCVNCLTELSHVTRSVAVNSEINLHLALILLLCVRFGHDCAAVVRLYMDVRSRRLGHRTCLRSCCHCWQSSASCPLGCICAERPSPLLYRRAFWLLG